MILTHWFAIYDEDQDGQLQLEAGWDRYREHGLDDERNIEKVVACCCAVHNMSCQVFQFCTARTTHGWLLIISYL